MGLKCCVRGILPREGSKTYKSPINQKQLSTVEADQIANHVYELEGNVEDLEQDFFVGMVGGEEDHLNTDS